jgi:hypothetical protein
MQENGEKLTQDDADSTIEAPAVEGVPKDLDFQALSEHFAERLIYVVGNARGGSTFTNSAVGIHPKILCVEWNDITFAEIWPHIGKLNETELREKLLRPKHYREPVAAENIGEANLRRWQAHVQSVCQSRDLRSLFCLQGLLFWIMQGAPRLEDCAAWCVKTNTWEGVDTLKQAMPRTRIIFVERDPRANSLSFAKVYARDRREAFSDPDLTRGALDWLRNAVEFAARLNRYHDALLLYFEQLVADPASNLNRIYGELGLDRLDVNTVQAALAGIEYTSTKTYEERGRGPNPRGLHTAPLNRWREQLSREQVTLVSGLTHAGAEYYGYEPEPSPGSLFAINALRRVGTARLVKSWAVYLYCRFRLLLMPRAKQVASHDAVRS